MSESGSQACLDDDQAIAYMNDMLSDDDRHRVDDHLEGCAECRRWIARLAEDSVVGARSPAAGDDDADRLDGGVALGRYRIGELLGTGAMGLVYRAHDPVLDRYVALKIVSEQSPASRARLLAEARAIARIDDRHVVAVHDAGVIADEVYVAMELVEGVTLADWLVAGTRAWPDILRVFVQAGRGLAAAHRAGIVHRDFKPANVLVGRDGRARVTDFGLARLGRVPGEADGAIDDSSAAGLTRPGVVLGTPAFMAPEQHLSGHVDARADQFAFCTALYFALAGVLPFGGLSREEIATRMRAGNLAAPQRAVPAALLPPIVRGLAADPADRWPSMIELLAELEAAERATDPLARGADPRAVEAARSALARGWAEREAGQLVAARHLASDAETRARELGLHAIEAEAQRLTGEIALADGRVDDAFTALHAAAATAVAGGHDREAAEAWISLVGAHWINEVDQGLTWIEHARAAAARAGNPDDLRVRLGLAHTNLLSHAGRHDEALGVLAEAERYVSRDTRPMTQAELLTRRAYILRDLGRLVESRDAFGRALAIERELGDGTPRVASALTQLAAVDALLGYHTSALAGLDEAEAIYTRLYGPSHPPIAFVLQSRIYVHVRGTGRADAALADARRLLDLVAACNLGDRALGYALLGLGDALLAAGQPAEAIEPLEHCLTLRERQNLPRRELGRVRFALARARWESGTGADAALDLARAAHRELEGDPLLADVADQIARWIAERTADRA